MNETGIFREVVWWQFKTRSEVVEISVRLQQIFSGFYAPKKYQNPLSSDKVIQKKKKHKRCIVSKIIGSIIRSIIGIRYNMLCLNTYPYKMHGFKYLYLLYFSE